MKLKSIVCAAGWLLLFVFLFSGYLFNTAQKDSSFNFQPIQWTEHLRVFEGALSCTLLPGELNERLAEIKAEIFTSDVHKEELNDGYIFYFDDKGDLADKVLDFLKVEKKCCPFFKFDLSILPYQGGMALKISGGPQVKSFIDYYMS